MKPDKPSDARLAMAYELLRSLLEYSATGQEESRDQWQLPFVPPQASDGLMSATDLLTWWFRPTSRTADPWDDYFTPPVQTALAQRRGSAGTHPPARPTDMMPYLAVPPRAPELLEELEPWIDLQALVGEPEEVLEEDHAQAAVQSLYEFIHALGRRDVDAALELVTDDYHVLEDDTEIDRFALRHQIESLLDSLRGWQLEISLVEIPRPLRHPNGILIYIEIQIDATQLQTDLRRSIVQRRLAVLEQHGAQHWQISALSPV